MKSLVYILFFSIYLMLSTSVDAQRNRYKKRKNLNKSISNYKGGVAYGMGRFRPYFFIGGNLTAANYFGDLAPLSRNFSTELKFTRAGAGGHLGYKFHNSMAVRLGLNYFRVYGNDYSSDVNSEKSKPRYMRNLSFRNDLIELNLALQLYLFPNHGSIRQRFPINGYIFGGVAGFYHNPKGITPNADYQKSDGSTQLPDGVKPGDWVSLKPLGTEGQNLGVKAPYSNFSFAIPLGIGGIVRVPGLPIDIGLEFGMRVTFTDYLDDVSDRYVNLSKFKDPLARIMSDRSAEPTMARTGQAREIEGFNINPSSGFRTNVDLGVNAEGIRGNPKNDDFYFLSQIKLTYYISKKARRRGKFR